MSQLIKATNDIEKIVPIKPGFANVIIRHRVVENCHTSQNLMGIWPPKRTIGLEAVTSVIIQGYSCLLYPTGGSAVENIHGQEIPETSEELVHYSMNGTIRDHLKPGMRVKIVLKKDQRTGVLTEGIIKSILTKSPQHPHGIKVLLESGLVGRVKEIAG
jgi:uncharacterized repeat protein (TIGR03833 family)